MSMPSASIVCLGSSAPDRGQGEGQHGDTQETQPAAEFIGDRFMALVNPHVGRLRSSARDLRADSARATLRLNLVPQTGIATSRPADLGLIPPTQSF